MVAEKQQRRSDAWRGVIITALIVLIVSPVSVTADWFCGWSYRKQIDITEQSGNALTNYQIQLTVVSEAGMELDFSDLRFTLDDGVTEIDYWIEQFIPTSYAIVWLEVPSLPALSTTTIYIYYGNGSVSTTSNGTNTFVFFDDMSTWSGWSSYGSGGVSQNTAVFGFPVLRKQSNNDPHGGWKSIGTNVSDFRLLVREYRRTESDGGTMNRYGLESSSFNGYGIRRRADVTGSDQFGFERRVGGSGSASQTTNLDQPRDNWYITELTRYGGGASNITATLYDAAHVTIGSRTGTDATYSSFSRFVVHGGYYFYIDWVAVGSFVASEPNVNVGPEEGGGCATISGLVFEDRAGDAVPGGQSIGDAENPPCQGVTVYLYQDGGDGSATGIDDTLIGTSNTSALGVYSFNSLNPGSYWVTANSKTVAPNSGFAGGFAQGDVWAEQTYGAVGTLCSDDDGLRGSTILAVAGACHGGRRSDVSDDSTSLLTSEHVVAVTVVAVDITGIDIGFSFNAVTTIRDGDDDLAANRSIQGSLAQFVWNANAIAAANSMRFVPAATANSIGGGGSWWTVTLTGGLATLNDAGTVIDGTAYSYVDGVTVRDTNPGTAGNSGAPVGTGADGVEGTGDEPVLPDYERPELEIDGSDIGNVIELSGDNQVVKRLALVNASGGAGIEVSGGSGSVVRENFVGVHADGSDPGVGLHLLHGVMVSTGEADATGNLIAYIRNTGCFIQNTGTASGNDVYDIGFDFDVGDGITIEGSNGETIAVRENRVERVAAYGIEWWHAPGPATVENNTVLNTGYLGGEGEIGGIRVFGTGNLIRRNIVSGAVGAAITVVSTGVPTTGNTISQNSLYNNGSIGIDLDPTNVVGNPNGDGVTPNDGMTTPGTPNDLFDYPVFTVASLTGTTLHLEGYVGTLGTPLLGAHVVEVFKVDDDGNNNGEVELGDGQSVPHGEGRYYIGSLTTDVDGTFNSDVTVPGIVSLNPGDPITGTATSVTFGTSESGPNATITGDMPDIVMVKASTTLSDPVNGGANPKAIPGATIAYTIQLTNQGEGATDNNTVEITDAVPPNTALFVGDIDGPDSGPVLFQDGTTPSGLTYTFISLASTLDDISFSNNGGVSYNYVPVPDGDGFDGNVTHLMLNLKGIFEASDGVNHPEFDLGLRVMVE